MKKILIILLLFLIHVSFSQGEDPCITNPTDEGCFEDFETILPSGEDIKQDEVDEPSGTDGGNEIQVENEGFFSSWIFKILIGLFVLIVVVILYLYFRNRANSPEGDAEANPPPKF